MTYDTKFRIAAWATVAMVVAVIGLQLWANELTVNLCLK